MQNPYTHTHVLTESKREHTNSFLLDKFNCFPDCSPDECFTRLACERGKKQQQQQIIK